MTAKLGQLSIQITEMLTKTPVSHGRFELPVLVMPGTRISGVGIKYLSKKYIYILKVH
jgi:hypothetical protein